MGRVPAGAPARPSVLTAWILTRLLTVGVLVGVEAAMGTSGDVLYFGRTLSHVARDGLGHTLVEYPLLAVAVIALPRLMALLAGSVALYPWMMLLVMLVVDAAFTVVLVRQRSSGRDSAVRVWLWAVPLLGGLCLMRFDLVVGVVVALAMLLLARRPQAASATLAVATALKLWPVILLPAFVAATRRRGWFLVPYVTVGLAVAVASVAVAGWPRLFSPLRYQVDRGLQVESVSASPVMAGWLVHPASWDMRLEFKAVEVFGPLVDAMLLVSTVLSALLVAGLLALWWRALRQTEPLAPGAVVWVCLASVSGYTVCSKVFSPQYLLWLLPMVAVGLVLDAGPALRLWARWLLVTAGVSHVVYPLLYRYLVIHDWQSAPAVALLIVRNALMVGLFVAAAVAAWRATGSPSPDAAHEHAPTTIGARRLRPGT
jgi:uncharacterized membrane protein